MPHIQVDWLGGTLLARLRGAWGLASALRSLRCMYLLAAPALQPFTEGLFRHACICYHQPALCTLCTSAHMRHFKPAQGKLACRRLDAGTPLRDVPLWELQDLLERALGSTMEDGGACAHHLPAPGSLTGCMLAMAC